MDNCICPNYLQDMWALVQLALPFTKKSPGWNNERKQTSTPYQQQKPKNLIAKKINSVPNIAWALYSEYPIGTLLQAIFKSNLDYPNMQKVRLWELSKHAVVA